MAGLIAPFTINTAFLNKEDISDVHQFGCYGLRASGGVQAGVLLVFAYDNIKIQVVFGSDIGERPIKKFRYTQIWTNEFYDWIEL